MIKKGDTIERRNILDETDEYHIYYILCDNLIEELNLSESKDNRYHDSNYLCLNLTSGIIDRDMEFMVDYADIIFWKYGKRVKEIPYGMLITDDPAVRAVKLEKVPEKELLELLRAQVNHPYLFV